MRLHCFNVSLRRGEVRLNYQLRFSRVACAVVAGLLVVFMRKSAARKLSGAQPSAHKLKTENASGTHAATDTHRYHAVSMILPPYFVNQAHGEFCPCATERVS